MIRVSVMSCNEQMFSINISIYLHGSHPVHGAEDKDCFWQDLPRRQAWRAGQSSRCFKEACTHAWS